jgi:hypothetical protein
MGSIRISHGWTRLVSVGLLLGSQMTAGYGLAAPIPAPGRISASTG